jgi:hypothetical protein
MINPNYNTDYFEVGDIVLYVPQHALNDYRTWVGGGDIEEGGIFDPKMSFYKFEQGIVSSKNDTYVFVKYWHRGEKIRKMKEQNFLFIFLVLAGLRMGSRIQIFRNGMRDYQKEEYGIARDSVKCFVKNKLRNNWMLSSRIGGKHF